MADKVKDTVKKTDAVENEQLALIDPIYQKYVKSVIRSIGSSDFYEFFMDSISRAENEIQFSKLSMLNSVKAF